VAVARRTLGADPVEVDVDLTGRVLTVDTRALRIDARGDRFSSNFVAASRSIHSMC